MVRPQAAALLSARELHFIWRGIGPEASYRLTLTEDVGDVVWRVSTTDTQATLPPDSALARERTSFWYVDVLLLDGKSSTSGVREFRSR